MAEVKPKKRGRGRPKKQPKQLPKFNNEMEIREYILKTSLELSLELVEVATKKNNIKKPNVANAKNQQYKTALSSLKVSNDILKDLQINKLEEKLALMQEGLNTTNISYDGASTETLAKVEQLSKLTEQLADLKD